MALWQAGEAARARLSAIATSLGVTFQQYMILRILLEHPDHGLPTLEIARRVVERAPGITGLIDRLERRGLVRRERDKSDRRQIRCVLTDEGRALAGQLEQQSASARSEAVSMLTSHEVAALRHLLLRMARK